MKVREDFKITEKAPTMAFSIVSDCKTSQKSVWSSTQYSEREGYYLFTLRVPTGLEDVSKYVELFSTLYASGKWSVQVSDAS